MTLAVEMTCMMCGRDTGRTEVADQDDIPLVKRPRCIECGGSSVVSDVIRLRATQTMEPWKDPPPRRGRRPAPKPDLGTCPVCGGKMVIRDGLIAAHKISRWSRAWCDGSNRAI